MEQNEIEIELQRISAQLNQLAINVSILMEMKEVFTQDIRDLQVEIKTLHERVDRHDNFMNESRGALKTTETHMSYIFRLLPTILIAILIIMIVGDQIDAAKIIKNISSTLLS